MKIGTRLFLLVTLLAFTQLGFAHNTGEEVSEDKPLCVNITSVTVKAENCGQANGSITVLHDGTAPFTYTWTPNVSNTNSATGLSAGSYKVEIFDSNGCDAETTLVVTETQPPILTLVSTTDGGCLNGGFATVASSDPTATAVWSGNPAQTGFTLQNAPPGLYTCTVTDSVGCVRLINAQLNAPDPMVLGIVGTADTCGSEDASATVDVLVSGFPPFTYQWDDPANQTTRTATNLPAGTYEVLVTDATGCEARKSITINLIDQLNIDIRVTNPRCHGDEDGSIVINVSGGNGPYNFNWNPDESRSNRASNLPGGTYVVDISDAMGDACNTTENIVVTEPEPIYLNFDFNKSSDCGLNDAKVWVAPTNTQGPYVTVWDTFSTDVRMGTGDTLRDIYAGIYWAYLEDSAGCKTAGRVVVTSEDEITVAVDIQQEDDCGLGQGIARALVSGGTRPFKYQWFTFPINQNSESPFAENLEQGKFFIVVSDANDCINIDFFEMPGRPPLEVVSTNSTANYCDLANGSTRATFKGGTPPYSYQWNTLPVQTTQTAIGLPEGNYRVIISDVNNCKDTATVFVEDQSAFSIAADASPISCFGEADGTANVVIERGLAPFDITWSSDPPQFTQQASNLPEGKYLVTVKDAGGCEQSAFAVVGSVDPLTAQFTFSPDTMRPVILSKAAFAFANRSEGEESYSWDFGDGNTSTLKSPTHIYSDTGQFYVTLTVFNNNGQCTDEITHGPFIVISPGTAFIPSAFSPNSDGINDYLEFGGVFLELFDFQLYDRWGRLVWAASSINDKWDGQFQDGSTAPEGVYVFKMVAVGIDRVQFEEQGTITLIR